MISFELTSEQKDLQLKFRLLARERLRPDSLLLDKNPPGPIDKNLLLFIAEEKLNSFLIPEEYGGHLLDRVTLSLVMEELGYGCAGLASIYGATAHAVSVLMIGGAPEQKGAFLPLLLDPAGEVASYVITEEKGGSDTTSFDTTARLEGDHYVLNGSKGPIINAGNAALTIVWASSDKAKGRAGIDAFIVPRDTPGMSFGPFDDKPGLRCAPTARLFFNDAAVPASNLIGLPGSGYLLIMQTLDIGRAMVGAACVGIARAALEEATDFAKDRVIKNRPIFDNQGIGFMLAELATELDAARLLVWRACRLMDLNEDYTTQSSMANLFASEVAARTTNECIQILGQRGVIHPSFMSKYQRDAQILRVVEGTSQIQKMIIASQL
ncbi:MAG: acyl-CoA dehydrogenase family protein [Deltaproteobacteria bacterium]|nr:acyl-CoA dehydrogenase family protein [Deltaproteobacteria bacterium]